MKILRNLYHYINILSLDVAAGAVICSLFFGRIFGATVSLFALVSLGLTVWIIYTLDHLRDARAIRHVAATDRHRFHQQHFKAILRIVVILAAADFAILWFLPREVVLAGMILWAVVVVYLLLQSYLKFLKEFFVALLYTAGVLLPVLPGISFPLEPVHQVLIGKFFITALMNLLLFSLFDYDKDRRQQQHSFVTWFGKRYTKYGIVILGMLNILSGFLLWSFDAGVAMVFITMNLMLLIILFLGERLVAGNLYRILGDAVFLIPLALLL